MGLRAFLPVVLATAAGAQAPWEGVPERYRRLPYPEIEIPASRQAWEQKRGEIRRVVQERLGEMPARPQPPKVRIVRREQRNGYRLERLEMDNGVDSAIPGYLAIPDGLNGPAPAILLLHWHSGSKDGVLFAAEEQNVREALLERGYVLMAADGPFNGERLGAGPAGTAERTLTVQRDSLFKLNLWLGRTLWGMMLRDAQIALDCLAARPEVDSGRIGATGTSMGGWLAAWLAALDERVRAVAGAACLTRCRELIAARELRSRAICYFIPGILRHFDSEGVLGLIAPRPFLSLAGADDPVLPLEGVRVLEKKLGRIYSLYGAGDRFRSAVYEGAGHHYLPEMKREMAAWFERWLGGAGRRAEVQSAPGLAPETAPEPATGGAKWLSEVSFGAPWEGVPEGYRKLPIGELKIPARRADWERQRVGIRRVLQDCLGEMPPRSRPPRAKLLRREKRPGYTLERIDIDNGVDSVIPSYLAIPDGLRRPAPAILLLHGHSYTKESSLFTSEQNVLASLVGRGYILIAIDGYFSGERLGTGPAGALEKAVNAQRDSLFKLNLWFGRTLWGMMLRDSQVALDYLETRPEVDKERLGASGMSMGSTGAWWLAALDERVKAAVGVACFTRYEELIAAGQLRAHAIYYFIPRLLRHFDSEAVLGLIAPRAFLALTGDRDPTSPPDGMRVLEKKLGQIYGLYGARDRFRSIIYANVPHTYTEEMKREQAAWFERWLR